MNDPKPFSPNVKIFTSKFYLKVILYTIVLIVTVIQCIGLLNQYLRYEKVVITSIKEYFEFPAVTFCYQIPVNAKLELPNYYKRFEVIAEFYDVIKTRNVSTLKQSYEAKKYLVCKKYRSGFEEFCEKSSGLISTLHQKFIDQEGNEKDFDSVCKGNDSSIRILRYCKCGKSQWACLDDELTCISFSKICDGVIDCFNGHDEMNCLGEVILNDNLLKYTSAKLFSPEMFQYVNNFEDQFEAAELIKDCTFKDVPCRYLMVGRQKMASFKYGTCHTLSILKSKQYWKQNGGLSLKIESYQIMLVSGLLFMIHL